MPNDLQWESLSWYNRQFLNFSGCHLSLGLFHFLSHLTAERRGSHTSQYQHNSNPSFLLNGAVTSVELLYNTSQSPLQGKHKTSLSKQLTSEHIIPWTWWRGTGLKLKKPPISGSEESTFNWTYNSDHFREQTTHSEQLQLHQHNWETVKRNEQAQANTSS